MRFRYHSRAPMEGSFVMGSPPTEDGHYRDEIQREVTLTSDFMMGVTEVTQAQWLAVMGAFPEVDCTPCEL